jgi:asparagine synthase (glutamine-hydrolysing)
MIHMLGAEALLGRAWTMKGALAVHGRHDVELAADGADVLAVCGYVRHDSRLLGARALLELWRQRGSGILADLDGEHSIAASIGGITTVARDRFGTRPLYVAERPGAGALFSTAIGPLLSAGVPADANRDAVVRGLILGYVPAPSTALTRVAQVLAGELWTLAPRLKRTRWYVPREQVDRRRSFSAAARTLDAGVTRAVECALPESGRIGAFLSGGVDSSLVVARVHEAGRDVDAFTLHFGDDLPGELRYAQAVSAHLGIRHHVLEVDARTFVDAIEPTLMHLEDSLSEPIAVPNFLLARAAARSCDVVFTGEGGDPPFGGPKNIGMVLARAYSRSPLAPSLAEAYMTAHHHLADDLTVALTPGWQSSFDLRAFTQTILDQVQPDLGHSTFGSTTFVGGLMRANVALKGASNILVKVAKMVGAHDLALRSPLFGRAVVELALTIPPWQKLWGAEEKTVLRRVALRSLPAIVVNRPKRGMAVPLRAWFDGALGELARDTLTARAVNERGIFRWEYVERLLRLERLPTDLARSRTADKLWLVLVTELHQRTLERLAQTRRAA